jgi:hypothetical protein
VWTGNAHNHNQTASETVADADYAYGEKAAGTGARWLWSTIWTRAANVLGSVFSSTDHNHDEDYDAAGAAGSVAGALVSHAEATDAHPDSHAHATSSSESIADTDVFDGRKADGTFLRWAWPTIVSKIKSTKLDDFAQPEDNTDLDATASAHGLMPKADKVKLNKLDPAPTYYDASGDVDTGAVTLSRDNGEAQKIDMTDNGTSLEITLSGSADTSPVIRLDMYDPASDITIIADKSSLSAALTCTDWQTLVVDLDPDGNTRVRLAGEVS